MEHSCHVLTEADTWHECSALRSGIWNSCRHLCIPAAAHSISFIREVWFLFQLPTSVFISCSQLELWLWYVFYFWFWAPNLAFLATASPHLLHLLLFILNHFPRTTCPVTVHSAPSQNPSFFSNYSRVKWSKVLRGFWCRHITTTKKCLAAL